MSQNTLLVVDDDAEMREALRDALEAEGYAVASAANGREALALLPRLKRPCAMILDITMPVMSGIELTQAMRAVPAFADIPVVILTSDPSRAPSGLRVMNKSVNLQEMLVVVAALFDVPRSDPLKRPEPD